MVATLKRNDRTYAYDAPTYSSAIVDLPILWQGFPEIGDTQASTTTTIGFFTRDPIEYEDGMLLYRCSMDINAIDPYGLYEVPSDPAKGLSSGFKCDAYFRICHWGFCYRRQLY